MYCCVILQNKKKLVVPAQWVQSKFPGVTKKFLSRNESSQPNFDLPVCFFVQGGEACYNGFILRQFESRSEAETYIDRKRSVFPVEYKKCKKQFCPFVIEPRIYEIYDSDCDEPFEPQQRNINVDRIIHHFERCSVNASQSADEQASTVKQLSKNKLRNDDTDHSKDKIKSPNQHKNHNKNVVSNYRSPDKNNTDSYFQPFRMCSNTLHSVQPLNSNWVSASEQRCDTSSSYGHHSKHPTDNKSIGKLVFRTSIRDMPYSTMKYKPENEVIVKLEKELERSKLIIKRLDERAGPSVVDDIDNTDVSELESNVEHEVSQSDGTFSGRYIFTTNVYADRFYLDGKIKIKRDVVLILKHMNINVLQRSKEFDYRFVSRLIGQVFSSETLRNSSASSSNMRKTAYARLDEMKLNFVKDLFLLRVEGNKNRMKNFTKLVNNRCSVLRNG